MNALRNCIHEVTLNILYDESTYAYYILYERKSNTEDSSVTTDTRYGYVTHEIHYTSVERYSYKTFTLRGEIQKKSNKFVINFNVGNFCFQTRDGTVSRLESIFAVALVQRLDSSLNFFFLISRDT